MLGQSVGAPVFGDSPVNNPNQGERMGADYAADIKKYTAKVNADAVAAIVKYCGIALKGADSQFVSMTDPAEIKRVVDGFCAKKLGLNAKAAEAAVRAVGEKMKADKTKHRVTVYYLVAEHTKTMGKLG
jgi:Protein of unknown function (DUF2853)